VTEACHVYGGWEPGAAQLSPMSMSLPYREAVQRAMRAFSVSGGEEAGKAGGRRRRYMALWKVTGDRRGVMPAGGGVPV